MTEQELITKQQLEIEELKQENEKTKESLRDIYNIIHQIGGPLNDNFYQFNDRQLDVFRNIAKNIDTWLVFNDYDNVM